MGPGPVLDPFRECEMFWVKYGDAGIGTAGPFYVRGQNTELQAALSAIFCLRGGMTNFACGTNCVHETSHQNEESTEEAKARETKNALTKPT